MGRGGRASLTVPDEAEVAAIREFYDAMGLSGSHHDIRKLLRRYSFEKVCEAAVVKYGKDPRQVLSVFGSKPPATGFSTAEVSRSAGGKVFSMRSADDLGAPMLLYARKTSVSTYRIFLKPLAEEAATKYHSSYCGKLVTNFSGTECVLTACSASGAGDAGARCSGVASGRRQAAKVIFRKPESAGGTRRVLVALSAAPTLSLGARTPSFDSETGQYSLEFRLPAGSGGAVPSSKNMVLAADGGTDRTSSPPFEYYKQAADRFHCRYETPLSAFDAFGLALAATIRKW